MFAVVFLWMRVAPLFMKALLKYARPAGEGTIRS
jgi:hypothetical protein